jgi:NTP pyrophosphatase (non-canonical NTP hydrolase)
MLNNFPLEQVIDDYLESDLVPREFNSVQFDGRYYQPCDYEEYLLRVEAIQSKIKANAASDITISEYQMWTELNWLTPQGTYETSVRLGKKLWEEASEEYVNELGPLALKGSSNTNTRLIEAAQLELGDALWVLSADASNNGIDLEKVIASKIKATVPISLDYINKYVKSSPFWIPLWLDVDLEKVNDGAADADELEPATLLKIYSTEIHRMNQSLYKRGEATPKDAPTDMFITAADWHADAFLLLAYFSGRWSKTELSEIVTMSFDKLTTRVSANTIDKNTSNR